MLVRKEVSKFHSIVFYNNVKGFDEGSRGEVWVSLRGCRVIEIESEALSLSLSGKASVSS